ncbi:MAG: TonB-dependent receptor [Sphingomonadaceae bacterium]|nr:TonB-dependent receptor [Sphingomonadaceae bacterium]
MKFFRKSAFSTTTCLATAALAMMGTATAAQAQDAAPADSAEACADANNNGTCDKDEKGDIVVVGTGSRLTRPTLSSPVPLTSVTPGELSDGGDVSLGDALNDLPSLRSTYSAGNSTRFIGTAGLNLLDLRGLGISRTLVLVNGKRHVTASPGDYLVDVNTIPVDLLERVDVVTGGNSAVYGSDAVAGVVNFVLKRNYDGISLRAQGGTTKQGDRGNYFVSGTFGRNFADGRGNIAIAAEYAKAEPLYFRDRDDLAGAFSGRCQFNVVEPTGGEPNGTDGIFDNAFVCGVRNASISDGGTIGALDPSSNPQQRYLRFNDAGDLVIDTPTLSFAPVGSGNQVGGFGSTLRNTGIMAAGLERISANVLTHFDFSDGLRWFAEAKYVRVKANQEGQPTFMASATFNPAWFCDNGFLSAQNLTALQTLAGRCSLGATNTQSFPLNRFNVDLGGRGETHIRETYRIVTGFEGTFNDDWKYELAVNYGELRTSMNAINVARIRNDAGTAPDGLALAVDAVLAPAGYTGTNFVLNSAGQKVICRVNQTTITRPDCVPINLFGQNRYTPEAYAFINGTASRKEKATQFVASANIAGDLSQLFELPGGPIGFVVGAEYREETAFSDWDSASKNGAFFFNLFQTFAPPKFTVKEAYGEIDLPLAKDLPFIKELTIRGAGRVSDYNTATGTVWAWNVDGIYAPVDDVRFRVAYATSVRAPTQSDLFFPSTQSFAFIADPCDSVNITANPNRAANCAADGVPTTYNAAMTTPCGTTAFTGTPGVTPWRNCTALTSSTGFVQGGNPTLVAERGKSLTIGMVIEPRMIPGLNITVDYYRITVTNLIAALGAQTIINLCYDSPTGISNPFCATVNRDPATGLFNQPAVVSGGVNFAKQKTEGLDVDISYRHTFDNGHRVSLRAIGTRVMILDNYVDPTRTDLPNRQMGELGDPIWAANLSLNYDFGPVDFTYTARYIGKQTISTWEAQHQYTGLCPTNGLTGFSGRTCTPGQLATLDPQNNDITQEVYYPGVIYHNVRLNFELSDKKYNFYVGIDNLMDKKPPFGLLGTAGGDPYDTYGRFMYAGFRANF